MGWEQQSAEARRLYAQGLLQREIAEQMGLSRKYVSELINDPDRSKAKERKRRYGWPCAGCGKTTDGSLGRGLAPAYCRPCFNELRAAQHGTAAKYSAGCRCGDCREANRRRGWLRRTAGLTPPTHGQSGYGNYGCRCDICKAAHSAKERRYYRQRKQRQAGV